MFGSLGYWHMIPNAPGGSIEKRASALLKMWWAQELEQLRPNKPAAGADIARAMALELAVAALQLPEGVPPSVADLVRTILPKWAYAILDESAVYSGEHAGRGNARSIGEERLKAKCRDLDLSYAMQNGAKRSARSIADELIGAVEASPGFYLGAGKEWDDAPNVVRTVRRWRHSYGDELEEAMQLHKSTQIAK